MADFIHQIITTVEPDGNPKPGRVLDRRGLLGFARWFSGEATVQSLAQIRRELPMKQKEGWVSFAQPKPVTQPSLPPRPARNLESAVEVSSCGGYPEARGP